MNATARDAPPCGERRVVAPRQPLTWINRRPRRVPPLPGDAPALELPAERAQSLSGRGGGETLFGNGELVHARPRPRPMPPRSTQRRKAGRCLSCEAERSA